MGTTAHGANALSPWKMAITRAHIFGAPVPEKAGIALTTGWRGGGWTMAVRERF